MTRQRSIPAEGGADGAPVGRRVVLGLLGLGALGVVAGERVQAGLGQLMANDPTGLTSLIPAGNAWRYYSVTGPVPPRDEEDYSLAISGLVDEPTTYSYADLEALPQVAFTDTFHCVTGWKVPDVPWGGVLVSELLDRAGVRDDAVGVLFHSFDGTYTTNMTLEQARADDVLVVLSMYDEPVTHDHGGPVRTYAGSMYGYKGAKWLSRIEVTPANDPGYWEQRGYPLDGFIGE